MNPTAQGVIDACRSIAKLSECPDNITRTYLSAPTHQVHDVLRTWMRQLNIESKIDAAGNLRGVYRAKGPAATGDAPRLLIGSHIDSIPNSGAFDGVLGVVLALALLQSLDGGRLDYDVEVVAFSEEEGVRFGVPFIGSRALIGDIDDALLQQRDAQGNTIAGVIEQFGLDPSTIPEAVLHPSTFAYVEFHIEQGPVLEALNLGLGIVEAIVGQCRYALTFYGNANHAGTTPMHLRHDALAGAAEWIAEVERKGSSTPGLVATVGRIHALPGAANVIPDEVRVSLDVRHANDTVRLAAVGDLLNRAYAIASARGLALNAIQQMEEPATAMHPALARALEAAAIATGCRPHRMVSGAGHDAMVLAKRVPAAMLFLRSPGGISHHPEESVLLEDVQATLDAGLYFLQHLDAAAIISQRS
jgi:allantoate deiminase